jgi:serine/threonine protein kinase
VNADEAPRLVTEGPTPGLDDPRVVAALDEYVAALEAGHRPDRQAFLARHAAVAAALAECLEGVEALHEGSSSSPLAVGGPAPSAGCAPGTPLGDFRILREVGRGGMGVVYEAEQLSLGRRIALKVLPFALTLDPRQLQRFKNEARAAAQLHHAHIVPVYSVGCERGVHFYAMQYIEGRSLAEAIQGLRRVARPGKAPAWDAAVVTGRRTPAGASTGPFVPHSGAVATVLPRPAAAAAETAPEPVGALATAYSTNSRQFYRAVARLGAQAAEALEHAHECGVVHRDIKPANLLLDTHGKVWVTDFGLAQFSADAGLTQTGDLLGTLRYMSPEQAGGQRVLDHRTDVYSLGATLYELLTLRPPFDGADRQTLLHQILHDEPPPLRAVDRSVPAELETIVLKALAKAPAERYATAQELADDLQRFREDRPILARPPSLAQRVRKLARRHPSVVAAGVVLCVLTAAGSLASAALIRREQVKTLAEQAKTQAAYVQERQRAHEAEERFLLARESVEKIVKVCQTELVNRRDLDGLRRQLLEYALVYYQKLIEQRRDDPTAQKELADTRDSVQKILADLAVLQGALQGEGQFHLLDSPDVLDDLHATGTQRDQIDALLHQQKQQRRDSFNEFHRLSREESDRRFLDLTRASAAAFEKVLTPDQLRRLRQIDLQLQGPRAFEDPQVTTALKLTAAQKEKIRAIQAETFPCGPGGPPGHRSPGDGQGPGERGESAVTKIKKLLTDEQAQCWQELTGKPFQGSAPPPFGPPPDHPFGHGPDHRHAGPEERQPPTDDEEVSE